MRTIGTDLTISMMVLKIWDTVTKTFYVVFADKVNNLKLAHHQSFESSPNVSGTPASLPMSILTVNGSLKKHINDLEALVHSLETMFYVSLKLG